MVEGGQCASFLIFLRSKMAFFFFFFLTPHCYDGVAPHCHFPSVECALNWLCVSVRWCGREGDRFEMERYAQSTHPCLSRTIFCAHRHVHSFNQKAGIRFMPLLRAVYIRPCYNCISSNDSDAVAILLKIPRALSRGWNWKLTTSFCSLVFSMFHRCYPECCAPQPESAQVLCAGRERQGCCLDRGRSGIPKEETTKDDRV